MVGTNIDEEKCTGCGTCIEACKNLVYVLSNGKANVANPGNCNPVDCVACIYSCPEGAIKLKY